MRRGEGRVRLGVSFELPARSRMFGRAYESAVTRANLIPRRSAIRVRQHPADVLRPVAGVALLLELFYRTQVYYLVSRVRRLVVHPHPARRRPDDWLVSADQGSDRHVDEPWTVVYLPLALRRIYGGSWMKTLLKVAASWPCAESVMVITTVGATFVALRAHKSLTTISPEKGEYSELRSLRDDYVAAIPNGEVGGSLPGAKSGEAGRVANALHDASCVVPAYGPPVMMKSPAIGFARAGGGGAAVRYAPRAE